MLSLSRQAALWVVAAALVASAHGTATAQSNSLFGSSGAVSQSGGNFSQLGSTSSASRSTSSSGLGGQTAAGGARTAAGGAQQGSGITAPTLSQMGSLGAQIGQSGFVGGTGNSQGFVGARQQTGGQTTGAFGSRSSLGGQGATNFGALQGGRGGGASYGEGGDYGGGQQSQASRNTQRALSLRPVQRLGFSYNRPTPEAIESNLTTRYGRIAQTPQAAAVSPTFGKQVNMQIDADGVVTLRGTVESTGARKLAEVMALLEPGVRKVVNELEVQPAN